jgi:hypothetical protein
MRKRNANGVWARLTVVAGLAVFEMLVSLGHLPFLLLD